MIKPTLTRLLFGGSAVFIALLVTQVLTGKKEIAKESLLTGQPVEGWLASDNNFMLLYISQRYHRDCSEIIV